MIDQKKAKELLDDADKWQEELSRANLRHSEVELAFDLVNSALYFLRDSLAKTENALERVVKLKKFVEGEVHTARTGANHKRELYNNYVKENVANGKESSSGDTNP